VKNSSTKRNEVCFLNENNMGGQTHGASQNGPCPVPATEQIPLTNLGTQVNTGGLAAARIKVPVVIAEPTLQIVVESTINLATPATEIKRVKKHVFLSQVKLVPVQFARIGGTDFFAATRAKVFVAGHIRKNIEYATGACSGPLMDQIADVPFSGFIEISSEGFAPGPGGIITPPIIGISETAEANFLNEKTQLGARLDKVFFENLVKYNEQPYGELIAANMFELDFSPTMANPEGTFTTLTEKIVLDLTFKVLQVQQIQISGVAQIVPILTAITPPTSP
jgi:hypothetical protein